MNCCAMAFTAGRCPYTAGWSFAVPDSFYGAVAFAGDYDVNKWVYEGQGVTNLQPGDKFFGGVGAFGGASLARPIGRFGEWRYIGIEGSLSKEFGSYYQFRKNLADSLAQEIDRKNYLGSLGLSTEWIFMPELCRNLGTRLGSGARGIRPQCPALGGHAASQR